MADNKSKETISTADSSSLAQDSSEIFDTINSQDGIPLYGYFQTNHAGGFKDSIFADDMNADSYKLPNSNTLIIYWNKPTIMLIC